METAESGQGLEIAGSVTSEATETVTIAAHQQDPELEAAKGTRAQGNIPGDRMPASLLQVK